MYIFYVAHNRAYSNATGMDPPYGGSQLSFFIHQRGGTPSHQGTASETQLHLEQKGQDLKEVDD